MMFKPYFWIIVFFNGFLIYAAIDDAAAGQRRSYRAKKEFKLHHPCPATGLKTGPCRGYVIDHVKALACGGDDSPGNMQWQTLAEGKAKDKWERKECSVNK